MLPGRSPSRLPDWTTGPDPGRPIRDAESGRRGVPQRTGREPRRARRPAPATVTDADGEGWRPGNRVRHHSFGTGVVLSCQGRGRHLKLVVYFDRAGRKTLVPTIAKLEKI